MPSSRRGPRKFNALLTNAVTFHNALDIAQIVRQLQEEGQVIDPEDLAHISPYLTEHIKRSASTPPTNSASSPRRTTRSRTSNSPNSANRNQPPRASTQSPDEPEHRPAHRAVPGTVNVTAHSSGRTGWWRRRSGCRRGSWAGQWGHGADAGDVPDRGSTVGTGGGDWVRRRASPGPIRRAHRGA
ncbi:Tn3 family transposase [Streptomyces scopuliridis]|uniref:Tn3 family transposase n=1 Tax=Streptomyces scopuliridis TaxID=452529 RepID=UPI0036A56EE7